MCVCACVLSSALLFHCNAGGFQNELLLGFFCSSLPGPCHAELTGDGCRGKGVLKVDKGKATVVDAGKGKVAAQFERGVGGHGSERTPAGMCRRLLRQERGIGSWSARRNVLVAKENGAVVPCAKVAAVRKGVAHEVPRDAAEANVHDILEHEGRVRGGRG